MKHELTMRMVEKPILSLTEAISLGLLGLPDLVMAGYGFIGSQDYAQTQFVEEYSGEGKVKFFVLEGEKPIASLVVKTDFPEICGKKTYNMSGIVVSPKCQKRGLGKWMLVEAMRRLPPCEVVVGNTKTPMAVLARSSAMGELGFRTFYSAYEVTPNSEHQITTDHAQYLLGYLDIKKKDNVAAGYLYPVSRDILPTYVPEVEGLPDYIQAFDPIIRMQQEVGDRETIVSPLISIKGLSGGFYG